jgi:nucleoid-associated protein YgaU
MSVAFDFAPTVTVPGRPLSTGGHGEWDRPLATVSTLHRPASADAPPLRLTRRGVFVLALLVAAVALAIVALAARTAAGSAGSSDGGARSAGAAVTVRSGDTLWSIASRVAPDRDPRAEVAALQRANRLSGAALTPGQVLRVP